MSGSSLGGERPGAGCSTLRGALAGHHQVVVLLGAHQPATTTPPPILARTPFLPRVSTLSDGAPFQQLPIILGEASKIGGYFTVRLTVSVAPPPLYGWLFVIFILVFF